MDLLMRSLLCYFSCAYFVTIAYGDLDASVTIVQSDFDASATVVERNIGASTSTVPLDLDVTIVKLDLDAARHVVSDKYLSITLDAALLALTPKWGTLNFTAERVITLLRGLSPGYLRFGGSPADYSMFTEADPTFLKSLAEPPRYQSYSHSDIANLVGLASSSDLRLLFELNLQLRQGDQWDPINAMYLLDYLEKKGLGGNIDFELGNEPNWYSAKSHLVELSGTRIGRDYLMLRKVLDHSNVGLESALVGPDIMGIDSNAISLFTEFLNTTAPVLTAATFHHYYFYGPSASLNDYINTEYFSNLQLYINAVKAATASSANPNVPLWIGETSDSWGSGTYNVSDRYVSGFLWLDKLGVAAYNDIKVVMRQSFYGGNYSLTDSDLQPTPDYWLSYVYKQLVGAEVLSVSYVRNTMYWDPRPVNATDERMTRVYAHCTRRSARYRDGAVTMFAINMNPKHAQTVYVLGGLSWQRVDNYVLTPEAEEGILSRHVRLNGRRLGLVSDSALPPLMPTTQQANVGVALPPLTFAFFVFPDATAAPCTLPHSSQPL